MIRVRFAPSPTGYLHIGGVRTALFNWLFARHHQGKFILRIEDTDQARSQEIYLQQILADLKWLGLDWDEGPYFQSKREKLYQEYAQKLLKEAKAYKEGQAIILKVQGEPFEFTDLIRGPIKFAAGSFKDQVLIKSDGTATYNFACVIDDHDMQITHVIRGEDHISNTPKQMAIYQALGLSYPQFAHIPLIMAKDRSRLSKRKGAQPVSFYREQGYLAEAVFNFLVLLGWSPGDDRQIMAKKELIELFSLERIIKTAACFDTDKLEWMNGEYIRSTATERLLEMVIPILLEEKYIQKDYDQKWLTQVMELLKPRIKKLADFPGAADFFFKDTIELPIEARELLAQKAKPILNKLINMLDKLSAFDLQTVEGACRQLITQEGIRAGDLIHPVRLALTGKDSGPGLFELMAVLGKERVLRRLQQAVGFVTAGNKN